MSDKLSNDDIELLKGYFGKAFYKDIENYCDVAPLVLEIIGKERKAVKEFIFPFSIVYLIFGVSIILGFIQSDFIKVLINSDFFGGLIVMLLFGGAILLLTWIIIIYIRRIIQEGSLFEFMAILQKEKEKAEEIRQFLRKNKGKKANFFLRLIARDNK